MAKNEQDLAKESRWRDILKRQASSGQSVRAFCQQEQVTESAFYAWRRTIGQRDNKRAKPKQAQVELVPVEVTGQQGASIAIQLAGGLVLRLPESTSATWLAELVHALESRGDR